MQIVSVVAFGRRGLFNDRFSRGSACRTLTRRRFLRRRFLWRGLLRRGVPFVAAVLIVLRQRARARGEKRGDNESEQAQARAPLVVQKFEQTHD
jgi:hypothetical protein